MIMISAIILMVGTLYFVLQSRWVQTTIISFITKDISEKTNADFRIGRVSYAFFDRLLLEDVYLSDQKKDTMLYVKKIIAGIDSFSISEQYFALEKLELNNYVLNLEKIDSASFNFTYLTDLFSGGPV
jgi:hypothetical protein